MSLALALFHAENYTDPFVREDLQQLVASIQAQLGQPTVNSSASSLVLPSVQRGRLTIANGQSSATVTLTTPLTDLTRTEVRMLGFSSNDASYTSHRRNFPRLELTNTTTLTANLGDTANGDLIISWETTEWIETRNASI